MVAIGSFYGFPYISSCFVVVYMLVVVYSDISKLDSRKVTKMLNVNESVMYGWLPGAYKNKPNCSYAHALDDVSSRMIRARGGISFCGGERVTNAVHYSDYLWICDRLEEAFSQVGANAISQDVCDFVTVVSDDSAIRYPELED